MGSRDADFTSSSALLCCGFGTAYEGLLFLDLSDQDRLLITGLGPVGLGAAGLGWAMGASAIIATDVAPERLAMAGELGLVDHALPAESNAGTAIRRADRPPRLSDRHRLLRQRRRPHHRPGEHPYLRRCAFVGGQSTFAFSELLLHKQISLHDSWVTSLRHTADLLEHLLRWNVRPERIVIRRFALGQADEEYRIAAGGAAGKVCTVFE